jgi:hypothetical protein
MNFLRLLYNGLLPVLESDQAAVVAELFCWLENINRLGILFALPAETLS